MQSMSPQWRKLYILYNLPTLYLQVFCKFYPSARFTLFARRGEYSFAIQQDKDELQEGFGTCFSRTFFQPIHFEINAPDRKSVQNNGYPSRESARKHLYLEIWVMRAILCRFCARCVGSCRIHFCAVRSQTCRASVNKNVR